MQVELAYGQTGLVVEVPDATTVIAPAHVPGLPDEGAALTEALRAPLGAPPLAEVVSPQDRVAIVFSDITRPMPNDRVLPVLLAELAHVPPAQVLLINGLGTHRPNTEKELRQMLGADIVARYPILQHDAWDEDNLVDLGRTAYGHRAVVNRRFVEADQRILTGFVEPHLFAGFSGGPKAVLPAIAGFEAIMDNHSYEMVEDPRSTWGETTGNPVWEEIRQVAEMARPTFLLNVTLNRRREITGVFAGDVWQAHAAAVAFARQAALVPVERLYDIVITSNSGHPLDINLYQAVKGMSCAARIVKPGGSIIIAAECPDGVPDYGEYRRLVEEGGSVEGIRRLVSQPGFRCHDQWEAQLQAQVLERAEVYVRSDYLPDDVLRAMLYQPCTRIEETLADLLRKHGPNASVCVLPEGPQTIPYLQTP